MPVDPSLVVIRVDRGLRRSSDFRLDSVNDAGVGQGAEVTQLIALSRRDLAHNTAHDLTRPSFWEIGNDYDFPWGCERPDDLPDLKDELLSETSFIVGVVGEITKLRGVDESRTLRS